MSITGESWEKRYSELEKEYQKLLLKNDKPDWQKTMDNLEDEVTKGLKNIDVKKNGHPTLLARLTTIERELWSLKAQLGYKRIKIEKKKGKD